MLDGLRGWLSAALLLATPLFTGLAQASQLPLGVDARERVRVQEYWREGVPGYCVANDRDAAIRLLVSRWLSRSQDPKSLFEWTIPAKQVVCAETPNLLGEWLLYFSLAEGTRLGLLKAPIRPAMGDRTGVAMHSGLDGACAHCGLWLEQSGLCHRVGEPIVVDLLTPPGNGQIALRATEGADALRLLRATSDHLPLRMSEGGVEIDTNRVPEGGEPIRIRLEYAPVSVAAATLFSISARQTGTRRGGCCFVRGICVAP